MQQSFCCTLVTFSANLEQLSVLRLRSLNVITAKKLQANITIAVLMQRRQQLHRFRSICWRIEQCVKFEVVVVPLIDLDPLIQGAVKPAKYQLRFSQIVVGNLVHSGTDQVRFNQPPEVDPFSCLVECQFGGDGTAMRLLFDQAFRLKLTQRLSNRDDAGVELLRYRFLAKRLTAFNLTA